jgi:protoporphyrinogen IX oxidase
VSYLWIKVIHILAMSAWMAGLFYLPRLYVYHADKPVGGEIDDTFKLMERRLLNAIMRPACVVTLVSGLALWGHGGAALEDVWFLIKLACVVAMVAVHGILEKHRMEFVRGERPRSSRYFRVLNEVPTVLLIVIVIAVVVRPFS